MNSFGFSERMRMSDGVAVTANIEEILSSVVPGAVRVIRASRSDDLNGVDFWIKRECGRDLGVDIKTRSQDYKKKTGEDDLALELWSDKKNRRIGWTLNSEKKTDYILWFWKDTRRWALVPFPMLSAVFSAHSEKWQREYRKETQKTIEEGRTWLSECVFVPRHEIWAAIYRRFGGLSTNTHADAPIPGIQLDLLFGGIADDVAAKETNP